MAGLHNARLVFMKIDSDMVPTILNNDARLATHDDPSPITGRYAVMLTDIRKI
jgi:hypothetical protein